MSKAKVTSIYMMMGGVANFIIPLITGYLSNIGLQYIILLDLAFALLAFVTAIIVLFVTTAYLIFPKMMCGWANVIFNKLFRRSIKWT